MALVREKTTCTTVGELIDALQAFDRELPVKCELDQCVTVYKAEPRSESETEYEYVGICGDDPWGDDN